MFRETVSNSFIGNIIREMRLNSFRRKWRRNNFHNSTTAKNKYPIELVTAGRCSYGELNVVSFSDENSLYIGNYVSIAQNVTFIINSEHHLNHISTFPYKVKILGMVSCEAFGKGDIIVDDDVWIGYGSTILSGVHIGQGAVVAAGSVVTKDVPPYAIVGGVPAKVIKYRFGQDIINELMNIDYSRLTKNMIEEHICDLYEELLSPNQLDWMPKKRKENNNDNGK